MTCEPCGRIGDTPPLTLPGFFSEAGSGQIFPVHGQRRTVHRNASVFVCHAATLPGEGEK